MMCVHGARERLGARFSFLQRHATIRWKSLPTAPALPTVSGVFRAGGLAFTHLSEEIDDCTGRLVNTQSKQEEP